MRFPKTFLIPLLLLPVMISGCDKIDDTPPPSPAPTVISNDDALKELGGKTPNTTEVVPNTTASVPVAGQEAAPSTNDGTPVPDSAPAPEDAPTAPSTPEPAP